MWEHANRQRRKFLMYIVTAIHVMLCMLCNVTSSTSLTYCSLRRAIILTQTFLRLQFFQPSRTGGSTESNTGLQFRGLLYPKMPHLIIVMLFSYPSSLKGGSTRAAPARWPADRGEQSNGEGDGAASSFWLSFSSLPSSSSVFSPFPPVFLFIWAWRCKLSTLYLIQMLPIRAMFYIIKNGTLRTYN